VRDVPIPVGAISMSLSSVSCSSSTACTAVGSYYEEAGPQVQLVARWSGSRWSIQRSARPPAGAKQTALSGVSCTSRGSCIAVGAHENIGAFRTLLIERWNGVKWSGERVGKPPGSQESWLGGVSCASASACVAVGGTSAGGGDAPLIESTIAGPQPASGRG
jgi:hypothetical protein